MGARSSTRHFPAMDSECSPSATLQPHQTITFLQPPQTWKPEPHSAHMVQGPPAYTYVRIPTTSPHPQLLICHPAYTLEVCLLLASSSPPAADWPNQETFPLSSGLSQSFSCKQGCEPLPGLSFPGYSPSALGCHIVSLALIVILLSYLIFILNFPCSTGVVFNLSIRPRLLLSSIKSYNKNPTDQVKFLPLTSVPFLIPSNSRGPRAVQ